MDILKENYKDREIMREWQIDEQESERGGVREWESKRFGGVRESEELKESERPIEGDGDLKADQKATRDRVEDTKTIINSEVVCNRDSSFFANSFFNLFRSNRCVYIFLLFGIYDFCSDLKLFVITGLDEQIGSNCDLETTLYVEISKISHVSKEYVTNS